jgi:hypothetical protein
MARNTVTVKDVVTDFMLSLKPDDYAYGVGRTYVHNIALRGARSFGFDMSKRIQSLKIPVNRDLMCADLPDDFVDWVKVGHIGVDGLVYVFGENNNMSSALRYVLDNTGAPVDSNHDGVFDREEDKTTAQSYASIDSAGSFIFRNYILRDDVGTLYGIGGGQYSGEFRVNYELNRFELNTAIGIDEIIVEYIADEAMSENPSVHLYAEEALMALIYFKIVEKKAGVPNVEKERARREFYNQQRLANARMKSFTKEEALKTIRKNFKQSPKY